MKLSEVQPHAYLWPELAFFWQMFVGNVDNDGTKTNLFEPPIIAQYIRILPTVCRKACTLRMELVGCELSGNIIHCIHALRK